MGVISGHFNPGPSAAYRWTRCPGQPNLYERMIEDGFKPGTSEAAERGTLCHNVAACKLGDDPVSPSEAESMGDISAEEEELAQSYVDRVRTDSKGADAIWIEEHLDLSQVYGVDGAYGTADAMWVKDGTLYVRDAKFGRGYVGAEGNEQLICYGLGALDFCDLMGYSVYAVEFSIHQPLNGGLDTWTISRADLERERSGIQAAAQATQDEQAPLIPGPRQCEYCSCLQWCPAVKELAYETRQYVASEGPEQYTTARVVKMWADRVIKSTETAFKAGEIELPGYKQVKSKAAAAKWKDGADAYLVDAFDRETLYKPAEMKTPAQLLKALGKDHPERETVEASMFRPAPHTTIVPESDARPAIVKDDPMSDFDEV